MKVRTYNNGVVEITSEENLVLTTLVGEDDRMFSEIFILGINDSADNYEEWTLEQQNEWELAHPVKEETEEPLS